MKKLFGVGLAAVSALGLSACGDDTITIIVPFSAGGGTDAVARAIADAASKQDGITVKVENKTGGGGAVGLTAGANADTDGQTITMITAELLTLPHLKNSVATFDYTDFEPILNLNASQSALTIQNTFKGTANITDVDSFVTYCQANTVKVATSGSGAIWHLAAAEFASNNDCTFSYTHYNGATDISAAMANGEVEATFVSAPEMEQWVKAGDFTFLGIASDTVLEEYPDVPAIGDYYKTETFRGLAAPKGISDDTKEWLVDIFDEAVKEETFISTMNTGNFAIAYYNATDYATYLATNDTKFKNLIEGLGL